jgi:hypothetical protein
MPRVIGPLEFALALGALGAVGLAFSTQFGKPQRYLRALAVLVAFPVAVWSASLSRQIVFELRTDGGISSQMDSCTAALMPILVVVLAFVLVILADRYSALGMLDDTRLPPERFSVRTILSRKHILAIAAITLLGSWFGLTHWADWRINQPCL